MKSQAEFNTLIVNSLSNLSDSDKALAEGISRALQADAERLSSLFRDVLSGL
jgi:hypothetical protein